MDSPIIQDAAPYNTEQLVAFQRGFPRDGFLHLPGVLAPQTALVFALMILGSAATSRGSAHPVASKSTSNGGSIKASSRGSARPVITVTPQENSEAILHNPDMGWVLYENYPVDQDKNGASTLVTLPHETFPEVDAVALMFAWSDVEKKPNQYDFSKVDYAYDYWKQRGKHIQLRMSTETLLWWNKHRPPSGLGVPGYVLVRTPSDQKQTRTSEGIPYVVVDARNRFYRTRLDKFLRAVASHYSGTRAVSLVDLRAFGLWGEWHSGYKYKSLVDRRTALKGIIDAHVQAFPHNYLALSGSYDPDGPDEYHAGPKNRYDPAFTKTYQGFLRYSAFDYAMTKANITLRRDGVGGSVSSNERRLNEVAFNTRRKGPMMCEFHSGYTDSKPGGQQWLNWKVDDALSLHPNYINLLGYQGGDALAFIKEQPALFRKGLLNMGYRFVPTGVTYPATIRSGVPFQVKMQWINRGVGRAMRNYRVKLLLAANNGKIVASCDAGAMPTARWVKGESYTVVQKALFNGVSSAGYSLRLALIDPATAQSIYLPLAGRNATGSYGIGKVKCVAFKPKAASRIR